MASAIRNVLVTGGTRGIGRAIAEQISGAGCRVTITGTRASAENVQDFNYLQADFCNQTDIERLAGYIRESSIDVLINNAGITKVGAFEGISKADFEKVEQVNLMAPFLLCQAALPHMKKQRWGRIVNISSIFGVIARDNRSPYCASKFALDGMTAALSSEVAQFNVLVNCVCPGFIETEMTHSVLSEAEIEKLTALVPMRRLGKPQEIASLVAWLISDQNSFISGQSIVIDGGYTRV